MLETLRAWLATFPGHSRLAHLDIDYTDPAPDTAGLRPQGLSERSQRRNILGDLTVENRVTFGLYYVLAKPPGGDAGAANAQFLLELQNWIQEQSARGLAPVFGDEPDRESIRGSDGVLYATDNEGVATYRLTLTVRYYQHFSP